MPVKKRSHSDDEYERNPQQIWMGISQYHGT